MQVRLWAAASVLLLFLLLGLTGGILWLTLPIVTGSVPTGDGVSSFLLRAMLGLLCAACAVHGLLLVRIMCKSFPLQKGVVVSRHQAPLLWREVERIAVRLGTALPHRLVISDSIGASIHSRRSWLIFRWRHSLEIGLPLLSALPPEEIRAVIAHELAHVRHGDTRLGRMVYRAHALWGTLDTLATRGSESLFDQWVTRNVARSREIGRHFRMEAERAADAASVRVVSASVTARALVRSMFAARQMQEALRTHVLHRQSFGLEQPTDLVERMIKALAHPDSRRHAWALEESHGATDPDGTHPCLRERVRMITGTDAVEAPLPIGERECAASALLGSMRHRLARRLSRQWRDSNRLFWTRASNRLCRWRARADELLACTESLDEGALHEAIALLRALNEPQRMRKPLERLLRLAPSNAEVRLLLAEVLLEHGSADDELVARGLLQHAAELQPALEPGCQAALGRWHARHRRDGLSREAFARSVAISRQAEHRAT